MYQPACGTSGASGTSGTIGSKQQLNKEQEVKVPVPDALFLAFFNASSVFLTWIRMLPDMLSMTTS